MFFMNSELNRHAQEEAARLQQQGEERSLIKFQGATFLLTRHPDEDLPLSEIKVSEQIYYLCIKKDSSTNPG